MARANDEEPLVGVGVDLLRNDVAIVRVSTGADGAFAFEDLVPAAYDVVPSAEGLSPLGEWSTASRQRVTVSVRDNVSVNFRYHLPEVLARTFLTDAQLNPGQQTTLRLTVDMTDISDPLIGFQGRVEWDPAVARLVDGTFRHSGWEFAFTSHPTNDLASIAAVQTAGLVGSVIPVFEFDVLAQSSGTTTFAVMIQQIAVRSAGEGVGLRDLVFFVGLATTLTVT